MLGRKRRILFLSLVSAAALFGQDVGAQGYGRDAKGVFSGRSVDQCAVLSAFDAAAELKTAECANRNVGSSDFQLMAVQPGEKKVAFSNILFDTNDTTIKPESFDNLKKIAWAVKKTSKIFRIEGHADPRGNPSSNLELSERRAAAVKAFLISEGVDASRLTSTGMGDTEVIDSSDPAAPINRRVVFYAKQ